MYACAPQVCLVLLTAESSLLPHKLFILLYFNFFGDWVLLCSSDCPGTHYVGQVGLKLIEVTLELP